MNSVSSPIRPGRDASAASKVAGSPIQRVPCGHSAGWGSVWLEAGGDMDGPITGGGDHTIGYHPVMQRRTLLPAVLCLLFLLGACAEKGGEGGPAPDNGHGPRVVVGEDEPVPNWRPPAVAIADDEVEAVLAEAEAALEEGRLFGGPRDAIPLYLALRERAPDDEAVARGFEAAVAALLEAGRADLAEPDINFEALHHAHEVGAVARAIDPEREDVGAFLGELDRADEVAALNRAGEAELREGRLGEAGTAPWRGSAKRW